MHKIEAFETGEAGWGLRCARAIAEGEAAVVIPRSACLSARDAPEWARHLPKSSQLAARLCVERGLGEGSRWAAYLASVPEPDAPAAWTDEEAQLLAGTRAGRARDDLLAAWADECPPEVAWADFVWAKSLVMSRTFDLEGPVLIPFLDLANHDDEDFCALDIDKPNDQILFSLVATRQMGEGEPLATNYFGGRTLDPEKALDAFGWLAGDFYVFPGGLTCRDTQDVDTLLLPALASLMGDDRRAATAAAIDLVAGALDAIDRAEPQRREANVSSSSRRRALASAIVDAERGSLSTFLAHLQSGGAGGGGLECGPDAQQP
ncbi:hypothetical protein CTAYLR_008074 [Chrysophaeum taylorii]|uniref:SET domain-containing protein n=1 Tax=Chrysophaeum taylorii TaxID=2483200 RepID=A0AAD7UJI3_9STRA|nr:hypothetical protein CTAYLR_008074 [Chrysophaeum taylorii]